MEPSDAFFKNAIIYLTTFCFGIFLPFPVLLLVHSVGYSEILEELAKAAVIILLVAKLSSGSRCLLWSLIFGLLFGLSEAMFYLAQYVSDGTVGDFWTRFISTVPLHGLTAVATMLPIVLFRHRAWGLVGFILALLCHLAFNSLIGANL